tara:strand:+ start:25 stop:540 length:516 start_codon:yes stop_codon:yes gene_type:complete
MAITFHPNGDVTGTGASNFGSSGQIIQIKTDTRSGAAVDITHPSTNATTFGADLEVSITFSSTSNKFVVTCFIPDVYDFGGGSRGFHGGFSYSTDNFSSETTLGGSSIISDYIGWQGTPADLNEATYTTSGNCPTTSAIKIRPHFTTVNGQMRLMANSVGIAHLTVMEIKA